MCCIDTEIIGISPAIGKSDDRCVQSERVIGLAFQNKVPTGSILAHYIREVYENLN